MKRKNKALSLLLTLCMLLALLPRMTTGARAAASRVMRAVSAKRQSFWRLRART